MFGYVVLPIGVLVCLRGQRVREYHVSLRGLGKHLWIYGIMFALVLPAVVIASTTHAFRQTYPFYRMANRSYTDLALWELLYAAQFFSLEFFFRGFILNGLRRALGANAIFVMLVPYCMIHYGKPLPRDARRARRRLAPRHAGAAHPLDLGRRADPRRRGRDDGRARAPRLSAVRRRAVSLSGQAPTRPRIRALA